MSTAIADIRAQIEADRAAIRSRVPAPSSRKISTKGKVFTFPDGVSGQGPIQAIVLDFRNFNRYYSKPYNAQNPTGPDCFAISSALDGMAPHENAENPMHETCKGCPMNEWGSSPQGGKGKACRNIVRLAVIASDANEDDDPCTLEVSPTAIKSWSAFVNGCDALGKHHIEVMANIGFDPNQSYPSLTFALGSVHDKIELAWAAREKAQALLDAVPAAGD